MRRWTKRAPAAAAAAATEAQAQTAAQTAAKTAARAQAKVSTHTHTHEMVGDRPTPSQESEGTRRPKPRPRPRSRPDGGIKHGIETPDTKKRRERTALHKMDQEIASAINRALFHQKAPAHIRIMNTKRNSKGAITAITHPNATAEMALQYLDIIITAARMVDKGVVDIQ